MQVRIPAEWLRDYVSLLRVSLAMAECALVRERVRDAETVLQLAELSSDCEHGNARGFCNREGCT